MWCKLGNKWKIEGNYREPLKNKSMNHSRKINFWKNRTTRKRNAQKPKNSDTLVVA
jgi:hypothetical protein